MFPLRQLTFLKGPALLHFIDVLLNKAASPNHAVRLLESHFLDDRAKRINNGIWMELSFDSVKSVECSQSQEVTYEAVMNDLIARMSELADIHTGSGDSVEIMAKTIAAVRRVEVFSLVSRNPPQKIQDLNFAL